MENIALACQTKFLAVGKEMMACHVICEHNDFAVHCKTNKRLNVIFFWKPSFSQQSDPFKVF
jgi:hypothetical protein